MRLGYVTGATPDKWARAWRDRRREPLELVQVTEADQERAIRDAEVDMCLVRLPVHREGMHLVTLYEEAAVAVAHRDHFIAAAEELSTADLTDEQLVRPHSSGWTPDAEQLAWPPMNERDAVETVAAGTGIVILPASVARLHHRKDVLTRPVTDLDPTQVGLAWLVQRDGEDVQAFVGIVKGRTARTTR